MNGASAAALLRAALLARRRRPGPRAPGATAARRGEGYEFAELRAYAAGDDPRRIDWAATARSGEMQTRVLFEEHALTLAACVDGSGSMRVGRTRSAHDVACEAAALWYGIARDEDRCARISSPHSLRSSTSLQRGRAAAAACAAGREDSADPAEALRAASVLLSPGTALLVISDFHDLDAAEGKLERTLRLCARRCDLTALFVRDPWRDDFPLRGFVTIRDAESGRCARIFVGRKQRERYVAAMRERERRIVARLEACGARVGMLEEDGVERALLAAFGLVA